MSTTSDVGSHKLVFSHLQDVKLVECVEKFPCVYDLADHQYKNQIVKDNAWKEIAEYVKRSVDDCKKRWRNIKDTYLKRQKKEKGSGSSSSSKTKPWLLADMLSFLGKVAYKCSSISHFPYEDTPTYTQDCSRDSVEIQENKIEETDEQSKYDITSLQSTSFVQSTFHDTCSNTQFPNQQSKRYKQEDRILDTLEDRHIEREKIVTTFWQNPDDDVDLFFKSIAMSVKKLRPELINEAKLRTLNMVFDLESRNNVVLHKIE